MRILVIGRSLFQVAQPFYLAFILGFEADGHEVVPLDLDVMAELSGWDGAQRQLRRWIAWFRPHLTLVFPPYHGVDRATVAASRAYGTRWVALRYDDPIWLSFSLDAATISPDAVVDAKARENAGSALATLTSDNDVWDLTVTTSYQAASLLAGMGQDVRYLRLPIAYQSYRCAQGSRRPTISFIGSHRHGTSTWRDQVLTGLLAAGLPLELWGAGWQDVPALGSVWRGPATHGEMVHAMGHTLASISMPSLGGAQPVPMIKLRLLEVAAAGGLCISDTCPELADYFKDGDEVLTYADQDSLIDVLRQVLQSPERSAAMGERARARVIREHGWDRWLTGVLGLLESKGLGLHTDPPADAPELRMLLAENLVGLATACERTGATGDALDLFRRAARLAPGDSGAQAGIGRLAPDGPERHAAWLNQVLAAQPRGFAAPGMAMTGLTGAGTIPGAPGLEAGKHLLAAPPPLARATLIKLAQLFMHNSSRHALQSIDLLQANGDLAASRPLLQLWHHVWGETERWRDLWRHHADTGIREGTDVQRMSP